MKNAMSYQYTPLSWDKAADAMGVGRDTFRRKLADKTGIRVSDLEGGFLPFEAFASMAQHFAANYSNAAQIADAISGRTIQADEKRTDNGRTDGQQTTDGRPKADGRTDEISGRTDSLKRTDGRMMQRTNADASASALIEQLKAKDLEISQIRRDFMRQLAELKQSHADDLNTKLADATKHYEENADVIAENIRLKVADETRRTMTNRIRQEVQNEYRERIEKLQADAELQKLNFEKQLRGYELQVKELTRLVDIANQKFSFNILKVWHSELSVINVVSNVLAVIGITWLFDAPGFLAAMLMVFFFKNAMKNAKTATRERAANFGLFIAFIIETIYGVFHFSTFHKLLDGNTQNLIVQDARLYAIGMTVIISGLSFSALWQSRLQAKDDFNFNN